MLERAIDHAQLIGRSPRRRSPIREIRIIRGSDPFNCSFWLSASVLFASVGGCSWFRFIQMLLVAERLRPLRIGSWLPTTQPSDMRLGVESSAASCQTRDQRGFSYQRHQPGGHDATCDPARGARPLFPTSIRAQERSAPGRPGQPVEGPLGQDRRRDDYREHSSSRSSSRA